MLPGFSPCLSVRSKTLSDTAWHQASYLAQRMHASNKHARVAAEFTTSDVHGSGNRKISLNAGCLGEAVSSSSLD